MPQNLKLRSDTFVYSYRDHSSIVEKFALVFRRYLKNGDHLELKVLNNNGSKTKGCFALKRMYNLFFLKRHWTHLVIVKDQSFHLVYLNICIK